jgi:circadian clock protein KaiC
MIRPLAPWATGIPGLDLLLDGGLTPNALVVVVGPTGAGKTILASQILFHAVQQETRALILTAYAEDHSKLLQHLRPLSFFNEQAIGASLTLVSLPSIIGMDIDAATTAIMRVIRESGARMVLLDGFQGITDQLGDVTGLRRLLATIATQLSYQQVTLLVTLTGTARDEPTTSGLTSADVVLGLHYSLDGWRHTRRIEVLKQRGRGHVAGAHSYRITATGMTIFPRLETRVAGVQQQRPAGRMPFQLAELDLLLDGGPTAGTTTLLVGAPGVGKTSLGLVWALAGPTPTSTSIFLNFEEQLPELQMKADFLGLPLGAALDAGTFTHLHLSPVELNPDELAARLLDALTPTTGRVVIDNVRVIEEALGARASGYLAALKRHLSAAGITTLLLLEVKPLVGLEFEVSAMSLSLLSDNLIMVQQMVALDAIRRVLAVLKMRFSAYDATLRELQIDEQGVHVLTPPESGTGVLDAAADASGLTAPVAASPP